MAEAVSKELKSSNKKNQAVVAAWIGFAATIIAASIGAVVYLYNRPPAPKSEQHFSVCIKIELWSERGSQPIKGARAILELKGYRFATTTDDTGCANFEIPESLQGQRATITVTTPGGKTKTINEDIRGSSASIIFYPND